ncbi:class I glutamine amidotransferase-like protein [Crucibulum laeve]|uniref:D-lactate dehydratase n=1 Tax=Crucibulum laeve TaxID=68775 RepID=A0A5C3MGQ9_9AGAR|nr:class I glutamine amidotransferase-like protein [Crucibulum laeve]
MNNAIVSPVNLPIIMPSNVLFVLSSADKTLTGAQTGWYLPEAAHPYYVLAPHTHIDFAAPKGPNPPIDEGSVKAFANDAQCTKFLNDETVNSKLASAKKLSDINVKDYDAIFYVGGHAPVIDLASDPVNHKLASDFWNAGKIVSAVCHGTAALVGAVDASGKSIFNGRSFTGFSNTEEEMAGKVKDVPFLLEDKISSLGGKYEKAAEPWGVKLVVDGKLITGQNPASATSVGEAILKALS